MVEQVLEPPEPPEGGGRLPDGGGAPPWGLPPKPEPEPEPEPEKGRVEKLVDELEKRLDEFATRVQALEVKVDEPKPVDDSAEPAKP